MKLKKYGAILFSGYFLFGAASMNSASADQYAGCDCAALTSCEVAVCATLGLFGLACVGEGGREDAICMCKTGGMKHCTNWYSDLENCSKDANDATKYDTKCSSSYLKEKYGEGNYNKLLEVTKSHYHPKR